MSFSWAMKRWLVELCINANMLCAIGLYPEAAPDTTQCFLAICHHKFLKKLMKMKSFFLLASGTLLTCHSSLRWYPWPPPLDLSRTLLPSMTFSHLFYIQDTFLNYSDWLSLNIGGKREHFLKHLINMFDWNCELISIFKISNSSLTNILNLTCGRENTGNAQLLHGFTERNVSYWEENDKIYLQLTYLKAKPS